MNERTPPTAPRSPLPSYVAAGLLPLLPLAWTFAPLRDRPEVLTLPDDVVSGTDRWAGLDGDRLVWMLSTARGGAREPLAWLSLAADHVLGGGAAAHLHDTNVAIHGLCAALAGVVVLQILRRTGAARVWPVGAPLAAALAAAAWALHPLRVEPVAMLAARGEILATLFGLVGTVCWISAIGGPAVRRGRVAAAAVFAAAAAASSPEAVGIVPAWALLAGWLRRTAAPREAGPGGISGPLAAVSVVPLLAGVATWAVRAPDGDASALARVAAAGHALLAPLWDTFLPGDLHPFRDPPPGWPGSVPPAWTLQAVIVALVGLASCRAAVRGSGPGAAVASSLALAAAAWAFGHEPAGADRSSYAATLPLFVALGVWIGDGAGCCLAFLGLPLAGALAVAPALVSRDLAATWSDDATLASRVVALDPANDRATAWLADAARGRGSLAEAEAWASRSATVAGARPRSRAALARVALERGDVSGAIAALERSAAEAPWVAGTWHALGTALLEQGKADRAVAALQTCARLDAESPAVWYALGRARVAKGDRPGASEAFARAAALAPGDDRLRDEIDRLR